MEFLHVAFFQGLYIDHNLADGTIGFASLKTSTSTSTLGSQSGSGNPATPSSNTSTTTSTSIQSGSPVNALSGHANGGASFAAFLVVLTATFCKIEYYDVRSA